MSTAPVKYPIGIQNFEKLRELHYLYVDKTDLIYQLVTSSNCVFLSRPRRFGKSLLLSTIQAYFEGKKDLFKGLAIENLETEWTKHTVLSLSLAKYHQGEEYDLEKTIDYQFRIWENQYDVKIKGNNLSSRFDSIIRAAYHASGRPIVILIDDYDYPVIATMHDLERSKALRGLLQSIYVNIKDLDQYIRFTMVTGFSRCSMMTTYSGLNNLEDISFSRDHSTICGFTDKEVTDYFQEGIRMLAEEYKTDQEGAVDLLKANYDGYHFTDDCPDIYNPFSVLSACNVGKIGPYWFQSDSSEFLIRQIQKSGESLLQMLDDTVEQSVLSNIDIFKIYPTELLYQTGYLTIKGYEAPDEYHLGIPNLEVREGLFKNLASHYFHKDSTEIYPNVREVRKLLEMKKVDEAMERLQTFMAGIPYEFAENAVELHYENNLFIIFVLVGVDARPEWHTSQGRIDLLLTMRNTIYIIELKRDGTPEDALAQIHEKDYARQFAGDSRPIINIGVAFSTKTRNITA